MRPLNGLVYPPPTVKHDPTISNNFDEFEPLSFGVSGMRSSMNAHIGILNAYSSEVDRVRRQKMTSKPS